MLWWASQYDCLWAVYASISKPLIHTPTSNLINSLGGQELVRLHQAVRMWPLWISAIELTACYLVTSPWQPQLKTSWFLKNTEAGSCQCADLWLAVSASATALPFAKLFWFLIPKGKKKLRQWQLTLGTILVRLLSDHWYELQHLFIAFRWPDSLRLMQFNRFSSPLCMSVLCKFYS